MTRAWPVPILWATLVLASVTGFLFAEGLAGARLAASAAIGLVAIKINIVFGQYMEVRWSHWPLRLLLSLWLAVVCAILMVGYWIV